MLIVLAWLPGTYKFVIENDRGERVFADAFGKGTFDPGPKRILEAAVTKYGYKRIGPYQVELGALKELAENMMWP